MTAEERATLIAELRATLLALPEYKRADTLFSIDICPHCGDDLRDAHGIRQPCFCRADD